MKKVMRKEDSYGIWKFVFLLKGFLILCHSQLMLLGYFLSAMAVMNKSPAGVYLSCCEGCRVKSNEMCL
jgi:hypothetical protein